MFELARQFRGSLVCHNATQNLIYMTNFGTQTGTLASSVINGTPTYLSGMAYDHTDGSYWVVRDQTGSPRAWNFTRDGVVLANIAGSVISNTITELEGVTVLPDGSLVFMDDTPLPPIETRIWHCDRSGVPFDGPVDITPIGSDSGQDIEYDPVNDCLLVICNATKKVFPIDLAGELVVDPVDISGISPQPGSWQAICIDSDGNWVMCGYNPNVLVVVEPYTANVIRFVSLPFSEGIYGLMFDPRYYPPGA